MSSFGRCFDHILERFSWGLFLQCGCYERGGKALLKFGEAVGLPNWIGIGVSIGRLVQKWSSRVLVHISGAVSYWPSLKAPRRLGSKRGRDKRRRFGIFESPRFYNLPYSLHTRLKPPCSHVQRVLPHLYVSVDLL